jgi:hypothetical protein
MPTGSIGEATAGLFDEEHPRSVIPGVVTLGQEGIDLAADELDQRERAGRCAGLARWEARSGLVVQGLEGGIGEPRRRTDRQTPRRVVRAWPSGSSADRRSWTNRLRTAGAPVG